jgi:hypothetical protein
LVQALQQQRGQGLQSRKHQRFLDQMQQLSEQQQTLRFAKKQHSLEMMLMMAERC